MELNSEIRGEEPNMAEIDADVAVKLARPTRPARPNRTARTERPLVLDTPLQPERPSATHRARVLEPDQVAASRGEEPEAPQSLARDLAFEGASEPKPSKAAGVLRGFAKLVAGLRKQKSGTALDVDETLATIVEFDAQERAVEDDFESYDDFSEEDVFDGDGIGTDYAPMPKVAERSVFARLDTPIVGVVAALCVSLVGVIAASAVLG